MILFVYECFKLCTFFQDIPHLLSFVIVQFCLPNLDIASRTLLNTSHISHFGECLHFSVLPFLASLRSDFMQLINFTIYIVHIDIECHLNWTKYKMKQVNIYLKINY